MQEATLQTQSPNPNQNLQLQSPTLNITEASREGLVNVIFKLDPKIIDYAFNTFYDSHIENRGTAENPILDGVANSTYYECPICYQRKNRDTALVSQAYQVCNGTIDEPHQAVSTYPIDWRPILKKAGLRFILGQINIALNANIATGNQSGSTGDEKNKTTLEERLRYLAWFQAYSALAVIVGYPSLYVSDWVITEKKLHHIFSMGFCTNFIIDMSVNIVSNLTKGKGMATVSKVLETKVSTEANTHHDIAYDYPQGLQYKQQKSIGQRFSDMFSF